MELTIKRATKAPRTPSEEKPIRVCAYCRVSTDKDDQWNSLEAQKKFFEVEFERNPNWIPCGIYADEGISGTTLEKRDAFNKMINIAKSGDIDLIVTKEVSRFSRNLIDTITIVDELARRKVFVYFLADRIHTGVDEERDRLDQLALYAQQESKRTSQRVKWGHQRSMERGVVFGRKEMYGYEIKREGKRGPQYFVIIEEEAEIVRKIFEWYDQGDGTHVIAKRLEQMGVKSKYQNGWSNTVILRILRQEKYVGDLIQGKTYTPNPLDHKKKYNRPVDDKVPSDMYYTKDHHPESAIIDRELWDRVQKRLIENAPPDEVKKKHNNRYWLSGKVFCGVCGDKYISMTKKQKGSTYRAWTCYANNHRGKRKLFTNDLGESYMIGCDNKRVNQRVIEQALKDLVTYWVKDNSSALVQQILDDMKTVQSQKMKTAEINKLRKKQETLMARKSKLLDRYLDGIIPEEEYSLKLREISGDLKDISDQLTELTSDRKAKDELAALQVMREEIERMVNLDDDEINDKLFAKITKKILVHPNRILEFHTTFFPRPIKLQYTTKGRGEEYTAIFDVIIE